MSAKEKTELLELLEKLGKDLQSDISAIKRERKKVEEEKRKIEVEKEKVEEALKM